VALQIAQEHARTARTSYHLLMFAKRSDNDHWKKVQPVTTFSEDQSDTTTIGGTR
jgi:hypothetical protein